MSDCMIVKLTAWKKGRLLPVLCFNETQDTFQNYLNATCV